MTRRIKDVDVHYVAEIGSNHGGKLDSALEHVEQAAGAGATAVKFQLWSDPALLDSRPAVQETLARVALDPTWLRPLRKAAHEWQMQFIVTPFDLPAVDILRGLVDMVKISAYDLTYVDLREAALSLGVPIILSTAMATFEEIEQAVEHARTRLFDPEIFLLQGVAAYPAAAGDYNLAALTTFSEQWPDIHTGISDHTEGIRVAAYGVLLGATMIEKHFRAWDVLDTPDSSHSVNPGWFQKMVFDVEQARVIRGTGRKTGPLDCEKPLYATCRRTNDKPVRG